MVYSNEELEERKRGGRVVGPLFLPSGGTERRDPRRLLKTLSVISAVLSTVSLVLAVAVLSVDAFVLAALGLVLALLYWQFSRAEQPSPVLFAVTVGVAVGRALMVLLTFLATKGASVQTLVAGVVLPIWILVVAIRAMRQIQRENAAEPLT
ncbi:hypothetical protein AB0M47_26630 [Hamadaea sp. NPDC051192]|uniref:hypothetical protein n=1 Tax=Hamadaea sp. NPDC051192 TaxID=3154940 RepID=UPI003416C3CF